jgi:hypothetical protein
VAEILASTTPRNKTQTCYRNVRLIKIELLRGAVDFKLITPGDFVLSLQGQNRIEVQRNFTAPQKDDVYSKVRSFLVCVLYTYIDVTLTVFFGKNRQFCQFLGNF